MRTASPSTSLSRPASPAEMARAAWRAPALRAGDVHDPIGAPHHDPHVPPMAAPLHDDPPLPRAATPRHDPADPSSAPASAEAHAADAARLKQRMVLASQARRRRRSDLATEVVDPPLPDWYLPAGQDEPDGERRTARSPAPTTVGRVDE